MLVVYRICQGVICPSTYPWHNFLYRHVFLHLWVGVGSLSWIKWWPGNPKPLSFCIPVVSGLSPSDKSTLDVLCIRYCFTHWNPYSLAILGWWGSMRDFVILNVNAKGKDVVGRLAGNTNPSGLGLGIWVTQFGWDQHLCILSSSLFVTKVAQGIMSWKEGNWTWSELEITRMILEWKSPWSEDNLLAHRIRGPMSSFKEEKSLQSDL